MQYISRTTIFTEYFKVISDDNDDDMLLFKTNQPKTNINCLIINASNNDDRNAEPAKYVIYSVYLKTYFKKRCTHLNKICTPPTKKAVVGLSLEKRNTLHLLVLTWYVIHSMLPLPGVQSEQKSGD